MSSRLSDEAYKKRLRGRSISDPDSPDTDDIPASSSALVASSTRSEDAPTTKVEQDKDGEPVNKRPKVIRGRLPLEPPSTPVSSKKRIETRLRKARPLPRSYLLGAHVRGQRLSMPDVAKQASVGDYVVPADPRRLHDAVKDFLRDVNLSTKETAFLVMGVYTQEDLINLALDFHSRQEIRQQVKAALELESDDWLVMKTALKAYACPVHRDEH